MKKVFDALAPKGVGLKGSCLLYISAEPYLGWGLRGALGIGVYVSACDLSKKPGSPE